MVDVIPFIVAMPKLSDYTLSSYSRWAEEVEALLALVGLPNAHKGTGAVPEADARSRAIILLTMERDLRDAMDDKIEKARTASDLWMAIKSCELCASAPNIRPASPGIELSALLLPPLSRQDRL